MEREFCLLKERLKNWEESKKLEIDQEISEKNYETKLELARVIFEECKGCWKIIYFLVIFALN